MVCHIECFRPELDRLLLANAEYPNQSHIDSNASGPYNVVSPHRAVSAQSWLSKRCGVEPSLGDTFVWHVGGWEYLIRSLIGLHSVAGPSELRTRQRLPVAVCVALTSTPGSTAPL